MLLSIRTSLIDYPTRGGDIFIMAQVDRIVKELCPHWQPISTAPRGGSVIFGTTVQEKIPHFVYYSPIRGAWVDSKHTVTVYPTHWMPIPDPPKEDL